MIATTSFQYRWIITISLISMFATVSDITPVLSQSTPGSGSVGSNAGKNQNIPMPAKPRGSYPDGTMRNRLPADIPGHTSVPTERERVIEERLRRGQMERPTAQAEVSDRLEQLHSGSAGHASAETSPPQ